MGITVSGVTVDLDPAVLDDWDLVEALSDMIDADETGDGVAGLRATTRYMRTLLGADYARVKSELRAANGGRLPAEAMREFCTGVVEAAGASKN